MLCYFYGREFQALFFETNLITNLLTPIWKNLDLLVNLI